MRNPCKLCGRDGELQDSHLVPRSVYKTLMAPDQRNPNPVLIQPGSAHQTSRQTKTYLLCSTCEQLLNKSGENLILPLLARQDRSSPIHELVTKLPCLADIDGIHAYTTAHNPHFPVDSLAHFGMAIFWKASVHSWHCRDESPLIKLGPYEDPTRAYVQAPCENSFPDNMSLTVTVLPPPKIPLLLGVPVRGPNGDGYRNFRFYVPGIQFVLSVGKTVDREVCFVTNPAHPIWVHDIEDMVNAIPTRMYNYGKDLIESTVSTWGSLAKRGR